MKKATFKIELEIEVEYNIAENEPTVGPYTMIESTLCNDELKIRTNVGKIVDFKPLKMNRSE